MFERHADMTFNIDTPVVESSSSLSYDLTSAIWGDSHFANLSTLNLIFLVDVGGLVDSRRRKCGNLWRPVAMGCCPERKKVESNPAGLDAWRLGGLDPGGLEAWSLGLDCIVCKIGVCQMGGSGGM